MNYLFYLYMLCGGSNEKCPPVSYFIVWFPLVELIVNFGGRALLEEMHLWGGLGGLTVWPQLYSFSLALPSPPSFMGMK